MNYRCANCVFFYQYRPPTFTGEMTRGQCRRYAPSLYQEEGGQLRSAWPMVHVDAFCGEHAMIEEAEAGAEPLAPIKSEIAIVNESRPFVETAEPAEPPSIYDGPEWRCVNCKIIEQTAVPPKRCFVCRCQEFALVEAA